ncbi:MAG TPA: DUF4912 domain-containing protein [Myxococcota bacterium]|nr:DUF4912 domain-containing protein [Myxococcota bacterium]HRY93908.1 DUF4912 domain-containing protein [Myxococcota bacterium]HSA23934.1 DUF4912 domain-containing protein [Myxococcota bacterium]
MKKLETRTLRELLDLAREWGLSGYSKLKKNELVKLLARRLAKQPDSPPAAPAAKPAAREAERAAPRKAAPPRGKAEPEPAKAREQKPAAAKASRRGAESLPEAYSDGRLVLLTRDPQWLYCFWDLTPEQARHLAAGGESALRLLERSGREGREIQRIVLPQGARSWYLHVEAAGKDYLCQLGFGREDGGFEPLLTSNPSSTPPAGMGPASPERFVGPSPVASPAARSQAPAEAQVAPASAVPAGTAPAERFQLASGAGGRIGGPASGEALSSLRVRLEGRLASELLSSALHAPGSVRPGAAPGADYWLWADAEVIVYGGTVPGSSVTLGGEPIALDEGGRFIARFAFPDGHLPFPIEGVSPDRRFSRKLRIDVRRETAWIKAKG